MSDFSIPVVSILEVIDHPNADTLSIVRVLGFEAIAKKLDTGDHAYKAGDLVVYVQEGSVVPEYLLRLGGFWDETNRKGMLSGSRGNRVKAIRLRKIFSQGLLYPVLPRDGDFVIYNDNNEFRVVVEEDDVAEFLGIEKYVPNIPSCLVGQVGAAAHIARKYDFDSVQNHPHLFSPGENVIVTEKLHGTNFQLGYVPGLDQPDPFGDGNVYLTSKGQGAKGLIFKNTEENQSNLYIKLFNQLDAQGLGAKLAAFSMLNGDAAIRCYGEIFGPGVQDLTYGLIEPEFRVFDISINDEMVPQRGMQQIAAALGLTTVPFLYEGPYDREKLIEFRDGKDTISGKHVREGIVIHSENEERHPRYGRKIAKFVSPAYLTRKGDNLTEFN